MTKWHVRWTEECQVIENVRTREGSTKLRREKRLKKIEGRERGWMSEKKHVIKNKNKQFLNHAFWNFEM
jgi:hypothetical protein